MEIASISKTLKIRSKQSVLIIDPVGKETQCQGIILFGNDLPSLSTPQQVPVISGPGEYEIGGIKITGLREGKQTVYSLYVDGLDILLTTANALEKMHSKLKEHHIIILRDGDSLPSSSVMALSPRLLLVYGEEGEKLAKIFSKEEIKKSNKYATTLEKLPQEMETVLLVSSS